MERETETEQARRILLFAATTLSFELAKSVTSLPFTQASQFGYALFGGGGLLAVLVLRKIDPGTALASFLSMVFALSLATGDVTAFGALALFFLAVVVIRFVERPLSVHPPSSGRAHVPTARDAAILAGVALTSATLYENGALAEQAWWPGLREMSEYIWNPAASVALWVGFGAVLASRRRGPQHTTAVVVSIAIGVFVWCVRRHDTDQPVTEGVLAIASSYAAIALQILSYDWRDSRSAVAVLRSASILALSSGASGALVGQLHHKAHIWLNHAFAGACAGLATGVALWAIDYFRSRAERHL
jgi:hypothetical protein